MLPRQWQGPALRDVLAQSIRRASGPQTNNGDSLRRIALHRNALLAVTENEAASPPHSPRPRLSSDKFSSPLLADEAASVQPHMAEYAPAISRTPSAARATPGALPSAPATDDQLEDAWLDGVLDDLEWSADTDSAAFTSVILHTSISGNHAETLRSRGTRRDARDYRHAVLATIPEQHVHACTVEPTIR